MDAGTPRPGPARWNQYYLFGTPLSALDLAYSDVGVPTVLGPMPAWFVPVDPSGALRTTGRSSSRPTCALLVHGRGASREECLRAIPMLQWRRFRGGWQYRVAAGVGRQADADSGWRAAQLLEASVTSPADQDGWWLRASTVHTNEPSSFGNGYRYTQAMLTLGRRF